jgi:hypothetical protein
VSKSNRRLRRRYRAKPTPPHVIRLTRIRVEIASDREWFVLRVPARREREIERGLQAAGFATYRPVEQAFHERQGGAIEIERRELPGYVFAGVPSPVDGRSALWGYADVASASLPPVRLLDDSGVEVGILSSGRRERPFSDVLGPFDPDGLQRFVDRVGTRAVAVLFAHDEPVMVFPAAVARITECEAVHLDVAA